MELLAAADLVAAEHYLATGASAYQPRKAFRDPVKITLVIAMVCLVVMSLGYLKVAQSQNALVDSARSSKEQRAQLTALTEENRRLSEEIASCVTPQGECAKRGQAAQAAAIESIVTQLTVNTCKIVHFNDEAAQLLCIKDAGVQGAK